jgi:hypothetical protein
VALSIGAAPVAGLTASNGCFSHAAIVSRAANSRLGDKTDGGITIVFDAVGGEIN